MPDAAARSARDRSLPAPGGGLPVSAGPGRLLTSPLTGEVSVTHAPTSRRFPGPSGCGFCPGHESTVGEETDREEVDGRWSCRSWTTPYPAAPRHEVLAYTPDHHGRIDLLSEEALAAFSVVLGRRCAEFDRAGVRFAHLMMNHGARSFATVEHPHASLTGWDVLAPLVAAEAERLGGRRCALCRRDGLSEEFLVLADDRCAVWCPPWGRRRFELLVVPHRHTDDDAGLGHTLHGLRAAVGGYAMIDGDPHFNAALHRSPSGTRMHPHAHVQLSLAEHVDPFGYSTGLFVSRHDPAADAAALRSALRLQP